MLQCIKNIVILECKLCANKKAVLGIERLNALIFNVGDTGFEPVTLPIVNRDALNFFQ